jgi:hypothetical protein
MPSTKFEPSPFEDEDELEPLSNFYIPEKLHMQFMIVIIYKYVHWKT